MSLIARFGWPLCRGRRFWLLAASVLAGAHALPVAASPGTDDESFVPGLPPSISDWGQYGLIEDPTARVGQDGDFHLDYTHLPPYDRYGLDATALPWLEFGFHYTSINNRLYGPTSFSGNQKYKDREVGLKLRLVKEGDFFPDISIGTTDVAGTGLFESQYLVASRRYYDLDFTGGVAWGQLGSGDNIPNPLGFISSHFKQPASQNASNTTPGGFSVSNYFVGPRAGLFGGIEYQTPIDGLRVKLEYDANGYQEEPIGNIFTVRSPVNADIEYSPWRYVTLSAGFIRGTTAIFRLTVNENFNTLKGLPIIEAPPPKIAPAPTTVPQAPEGHKLPPTGTFATYLPPVPEGTPVPADGVQSIFNPSIFPAASVAETVSAIPRITRAERRAMARAIFKELKVQKLTGERFTIHGTTAYLRFSNDSYRLAAMAIGRAARIVVRHVPAGITTINLQVTNEGLVTASVTLERQDIVNAVTGNGSPAEIMSHTTISHAPPEVRDWDDNPDAYRRFSWGLGPKLRQQVGGPNGFFLFQIYAALTGEYLLAPGLSATGVLAQNIYNDFNELTLTSNSALPHVRSNIAEYLHHGSSGIFELHADYLFGLSEDWYGRVSAGILEEMFSGVDGEVLYRPAFRPWAVGLDVNHVYQRDFDELLGNQSYNITTAIATLYYKLPWYGALVQIHAGQYLAGDRGATLEISRQFDSGVIVGAFATKTNVSAAQFGEGSFDKGFYLSIPLDFGLGTRTKEAAGFTYRPLTRDGGQMLSIPKPLYDATDDDSPESIDRTWSSLLK